SSVAARVSRGWRPPALLGLGTPLSSRPWCAGCVYCTGAFPAADCPQWPAVPLMVAKPEQ
ncbi:hypothetical protein P7K49_017062, partial [Saguinus oedipus]